MSWKKQQWSQGGQDSSWAGPRQYVGADTAVGVLIDWQHKGGKSFGWISPIFGLPDTLPEAAYHGGDVYVHWKDIQDPRPGAVVTFRAYKDGQGLGAENCVNRSVLRFALPRNSSASLALPTVQANSCARYLTSSVFFPELEDKGVTLRKYLWDAPMEVYELWGQQAAMMAVADEIGLFTHPEVEALVSHAMVRDDPPELVRDIPASHLPNVPPRFRVGLAIGGGGEGIRERLAQLVAAV